MKAESGTFFNVPEAVAVAIQNSLGVQCTLYKPECTNMVCGNVKTERGKGYCTTKGRRLKYQENG